MSKLAEELKMVKTGKLYSGFNDVLEVAIQYGEGKPYEYFDEFSIKAVLGCKVCLSQEVSEDPILLDKVKKDLVKQIVNLIFGEFRQPLLDLRTSLYKKGLVDEADKVSEVIEQMFKV